jgi:hypothetical protein
MKNQKKIIFLEPWATPMTGKIAKLLRKRGYYTVSIRILGESQFDSDEYFNKIITFNLTAYKINLVNSPKIVWSTIKKTGIIYEAYKEIKKLNPYLIIARSQPNWPCALVKIYFKKFPMIYFPYDIRSQGYISIKEMKEIGIKDFEINAEKYCFQNADGIMHKGADNELKDLNKNMFGENFEICPLQFHFPPYCVKEFIVPINKNKLSKKDKELHFVTVESTSSLGPVPYLVDFGKELAKKKIHLHAYIKANIESEEDVTKSITESYKKLIPSRYFHIHPAMSAKEIIKEISKYDFGLFLVNPALKDYKTIQAYKYSTGNKIASYLEAGIPFFYSPQCTYVGRLMKKYGLDFDYDCVNNVIKLDYKSLEKKVIKARNDFLMDKHMPEFEKFIKKVVTSRQKKNGGDKI